MQFLDRIRAAFAGERYCPPDHLEGYKRLGDEVYSVEVELGNTENKTAKVYLISAKYLQVMATELLRDVLNDGTNRKNTVPQVTHDQADLWYERIPELLISARQEAVFSESAKLPLPVHLGVKREPFGICPLSHLSGLRRAADAIESLIKEQIEMARRNPELYRESLLLFEEARTRRQVGDAILGSIINDTRVSKERHEEAEDQYWEALTNYFLVGQGLEDPSVLSRSPQQNSSVSRHRRYCKLDSNDIWKVTSKTAIKEIRLAGEYQKAVEDLKEHWNFHRITDTEREYETTVEDLLAENAICEDGYWSCCPFQPVYQVLRGPIYIIGHKVPSSHRFVWEYGDDGAPGRFITAANFQNADSRTYCDDEF